MAKPMTTTRQQGFHPWSDLNAKPLFSVNEGLNADEAESVATILIAHLDERLEAAAHRDHPLERDEAFVHNLLLRMAQACRYAAGSAP